MDRCLDILIMNNKKDLTNEDVKEKALRLLEFRNHSEYELREKLLRYGAEPEQINRAVEFCTEYGFLNDESYAMALARDLSNLKKYGKYRIKAELAKRGIAPELIENALCEIEEKSEVLEELIKRKLKGSFEKKDTDRAIRYFIYRGYSLTDIKRAIERLKADEF